MIQKLQKFQMRSKRRDMEKPFMILYPLRQHIRNIIFVNVLCNKEYQITLLVVEAIEPYFLANTCMVFNHKTIFAPGE